MGSIEGVNNRSNYNTPQPPGYFDPSAQNSFYNPTTPKQKAKSYYVIIPQRRSKLSQTENKIRQSLGGNSLDSQSYQIRKSPRGYHVAIGPFTNRSEAEQWNIYFRSVGLKNARVYYGK